MDFVFCLRCYAVKEVGGYFGDSKCSCVPQGYAKPRRAFSATELDPTMMVSLRLEFLDSMTYVDVEFTDERRNVVSNVMRQVALGCKKISRDCFNINELKSRIKNAIAIPTPDGVDIKGLLEASRSLHPVNRLSFSEKLSLSINVGSPPISVALGELESNMRRRRNMNTEINRLATSMVTGRSIVSEFSEDLERLRQIVSEGDADD